MKKILSILIIGILSIGLAACGSTQKSNKESKKNNNQEQQESIKMPDKEMGKGNIQISTVGGTSEGGKIPVVLVSKGDKIVQITLNSEKFDGSKLSYIFIDGEEKAQDHLSKSEIVVNLEENNLKAGKHKLEVVQFDTNKKDGKIITYKTVSYECKEK
ncbi:hypothetical protein ACXAUS_004016 [Clostridium sporogenes]